MSAAAGPAAAASLGRAAVPRKARVREGRAGPDKASRIAGFVVEAVTASVERQAALGIDVVNDGEIEQVCLCHLRAREHEGPVPRLLREASPLFGAPQNPFQPVLHFAASGAVWTSAVASVAEGRQHG